MLRTFGPVLAIFAASCLFNLALAQPNWSPDYEIGWSFFRGHFYKLITAHAPVNQETAQQICGDLLAALVKPADPDEFDFVASLAKHLRPESWDDCPLLGYMKAGTEMGFVDKFLPWCEEEPNSDSYCSILISNYQNGTIPGPCVGVRLCSIKNQKYFICRSI